MCQFNLAILDSDSDDVKLKEIFEGNGFYFSLIKNQNLDKLIGPEFKVVFTTKTHCDCGSVIGIDTDDNSSKRDIENEIKKLKRKKWSDTKIKRYLENREKVDSRKKTERELIESDELDRWQLIIKDCFNKSISNHFGILIHFYSGLIDKEEFIHIKMDRKSIKEFEIESLRTLEFDRIVLLKNTN
jgi:hypothetical protein